MATCNCPKRESNGWGLGEPITDRAPEVGACVPKRQKVSRAQGAGAGRGVLKKYSRAAGDLIQLANAEAMVGQSEGV